MGKLRYAVPQQPLCGHQASVVCVVSAGQLIVLVPAPDSFSCCFFQATPHVYGGVISVLQQKLKLGKVTELRRAPPLLTCWGDAVLVC